jgi:hypothetical protein
VQNGELVNTADLLPGAPDPMISEETTNIARYRIHVPSLPGQGRGVVARSRRPGAAVLGLSR